MRTLPITLAVLPITLAVLVIPIATPSPAVGQSGLDAQARSRLSIALTGDAIITRKLSVYEEPEFEQMIGLIRGADAAFTNLEMLFHDFEPYPMYQSGGTWMRGEPELARELAWAGFDMVSRANNHTGDYGVEGMRLTTQYVREAGLVQAGVGESLPAAREASFLETAKGRIALISLAFTFPDHSRASEPRGDIPARPGLNPLRYTTNRFATPDQIGELRSVLDDMGVPTPGDEQRIRALGTTFLAADEPGTSTTPDPEDMAAIAAVVNNASRQADQVIVTIHAHESGASRGEPAEFLVTFAHAMIDAGATMFVGHGPHVLRGIEIYKGKPIFYSLGDFIFQNETLLRLPQENYARYDLGPDNHVADFNDSRYNMDESGFPANPEIWEAVIAIPTFEGSELAELTLHPISLGFGEARWVRGRPVLADAALSEHILGYLAERSAPFGTQIDIENGVGRVRIR